MQRQLLVSVGTRALLLSKYTNDVAVLVDRQVVGGDIVVPGDEMLRRINRVDLAYEAMLERWAEIVSLGLDADRLLDAVDRLINQMERVRLLMALGDGSDNPLVIALRETSSSAAACHELCALLVKEKMRTAL
jgi:hypothetical protein